ncbi:hypothetical protein WR25_17417 [Diploscapter pachys]|uniref:Uncharacterized protein n=1 Tax=Diploscapter pachys TaxID=2018661 RepID=A0A2A2KUE7_9BILA|nr:hypothetical protein WR25_17417 [Diploscapter pachys]
MTENPKCVERLRNTLKEPSDPNSYDRSLGSHFDKAKGFFYTKSPNDNWQIDHFGTGGQLIRYDFNSQLSVAYVCDGMKIWQHIWVKTEQKR